MQPDVDLARALVDRRKKSLAEKYKHWEDGLVRIAMGVVLMSTAKEINAQGLAHFLHRAQGDNIMRPQDGDTHHYENGAFRLFKGVIPESAIRRCGEFSSFVGGCLWRIEDTCKSRSEMDICEAMGKLFLGITEEEGMCADEVGSTEGAASGGNQET